MLLIVLSPDSFYNFFKENKANYICLCSGMGGFTRYEKELDRDHFTLWKNVQSVKTLCTTMTILWSAQAVGRIIISTVGFISETGALTQSVP